MSLETLQHRAALIAATRSFFVEHGYWECETPILSRDVVVDANLDPLTTQVNGETFFLQPSPEAGMKRLLVEGAQAVFQITRAFRQGERGPLHNPEFTMLEWYRTGDSHHDQMQFVEKFARHVYRSAATLTGVPARGESLFQKLSYDEAFELHTGQRVLSLNMGALQTLAREKNVTAPESLADDDRDGWLNVLLAELVEPHLGIATPTFLYDYPATQCALARIREDDPPVAERFELYDRGIELCNGYHELTDVDELARRTGTENALRRAAGQTELPGASQLEAAMRDGLPACSGVALGLDRLIMLALGKARVAEVLAFGIERA
ncbi:MAG: EF-P lysine aminoacylase GenX [Planctomycetes bacterium]|nr:EF-P lysine aminoacylase GenX [Planctomycetota bacterium]